MLGNTTSVITPPHQKLNSDQIWQIFMRFSRYPYLISTLNPHANALWNTSYQFCHKTYLNQINLIQIGDKCNIIWAPYDIHLYYRVCDAVYYVLLLEERGFKRE